MDNSAGAQAIYFQNYCHLFPFSFLIWDHILSLENESRFLWKRNKSAASVYLFFILRYGALASNIPVVVLSFVTLPPKSCFLYSLMHQIIMLITELVVSVIMILRIYSLYGRSARVLWSLLGIGVCFIGLTIWSVQQGQHGFPLTVFSGCHLAIVESASYHLAAPWGCLFVFDSIIFGMTVYNAYVTRRGLGDMPIHRLLLRDGSMYFAATALANLSNIVTFLVGGPLLPGSLATFATCMSVTMVSRLMLNLHAQTDYGILTEGEMHLTRELEFTAGGDAAQPHTNNDRDPDTVPILPLTRDEI